MTIAALAIVLQVCPALAVETIPTSFVRALSSGDLRSFIPLAEDPRQLRERDWIALASAIDRFHCIDPQTAAIRVTQSSQRSIDYRIDLGMDDPIPTTWYVSTIQTAAGWRIRSVDDEATRTAKRLLDAYSETERYAVLENSECGFGAVVDAMAALPFYSAQERHAAEPAIETLLRAAAVRGEIGSTAPLLSALGSMKALDHEPELAEALAREAVAIATTPARRDAARLALGSMLLFRDRAAGKCILEDLAASADPGTANLAITEIANIDDEHYNFELDEAARLSNASAAFAERSNSPEIGYRASLNLGLLHRMLRSDEASIDALQTAIRFARQRCDAAEEALALMWLANERQLVRTGDPAVGEGIPELREALALVPPQRIDARGFIVAYLGIELHITGKLAESEQLEADAFTLADQTSDPLVRSALYFFLHFVRIGQNRFEEAVQFAEESVRAGADRPLWREWLTQTHIGDTLTWLGRVCEALPHYARALDLIEQRKALTPTSIDGTFRYMSNKVYPFQRYGQALLQAGQPSDALRVFERLHSLIFTEAVGNRALRSTNSNQTRRSEIEEKLTRLNRARFMDSATNGDPSIEERRRTIHFELDRLESERLLRDKVATIADDWKHVLDPGGVLSNSHSIIVKYEVVSECLIVFLVSRSGERVGVETLQIPYPPLLWETIADLRNRLAHRSLNYRAETRRLYQMLIEPIDQKLKGFSTIYIIPDVELWYVPFHLLLDRSGSMLIDRAAVAYAPSIVTLRAASAISSSRRTTSGALLAFGNPKIGESAARNIRLRYRDARLGDLPEAADEVRALKRMYGSSAKAFVGAIAEETTAKQLAGNYRILHFASHGVTDDSHAMYSALLLSPSTAITGDDGVLEAREIAELHLNADLAVLSACDTASGSVYRHQGIVGLSWAFLIAGCPTTVASQWNTESKSTEELMIAFHRHLLAGESKPQALRSAMLSLRKRRRFAHPFYWAPFVVIGAP